MEKKLQPAEVVQSYFDARNAYDDVSARTVLADDVEWRVPRSAGPPMRGESARRGLTGGVATRLFAPETEQLVIKRMLVNEDRVVVEFTVTGVTTTDADYVGQYCWVFDVADGIITDVASYTDTRAAALAFGEDVLDAALTSVQ